jgi:hypothetical protein
VGRRLLNPKSHLTIRFLLHDISRKYTVCAPITRLRTFTEFHVFDSPEEDEKPTHTELNASRILTWMAANIPELMEHLTTAIISLTFFGDGEKETS